MYIDGQSLNTVQIEELVMVIPMLKSTQVSSIFGVTSAKMPSLETNLSDLIINHLGQL
jgi:hypothetical protein